MKLARNVLLSCEILAAHKLRTLLSVAGMAVGVAAVILMVSVGQGAERRLLERLRRMGTNLLVVNAAPARRLAARERQSDVATVLVPADARAIEEECPSVRRAAAAVNRTFPVKWESRSASTNVVGTSPEGLLLRSVRVKSGRAFDEEEERAKRRVAVLGPTVVERLFGREDPVGRQFLIGRVPFEAVGVAVARGTDMNGTDQDDLVFIPLETAMRRLLNIPYVQSLYVEAAGGEVLGRAEEEVRELLRDRHPSRGRAEPYTLQNQTRLVAAERATARSMTLLIGTVAGISLLVGGVGILAVMLISVRDRTREIGLRRAVGARRRDIGLQFLLEAALLAGAGGAAGLGAGAGAAWAASRLGYWDAVLSWPAAALSVGFSLAVGLGFGLYPALRAARLEPIQALRSE